MLCDGALGPSASFVLNHSMARVIYLMLTSVQFIIVRMIGIVHYSLVGNTCIRGKESLEMY